jgi:6-phosphogluconolactonase/glucosamine-6-phosphate isomerase/deaminase
MRTKAVYVPKRKIARNGYGIIHGDQKYLCSTKNTQTSDCLVANHQGQGDTRLTLTPSVIPNSNYVIMVSD